MNCREVESVLDAWHDGELDAARSTEVEAHIRGCPACTAGADRLDAIRDAVRRAPYFPAPSTLSIPGAAAPRRTLNRALQFAATALAASLVTFFVMRGGGGREPVAREVVSAHVRSLEANHLMDVPSSDRHTVKPWFAGKLNFAPEVTPPDGFELAGGRLDYIDGRQVAALVLRRRQHIINVFTWPATGADSAPVFQTIDGYNLVHWLRGGMEWWAVSDLGKDELAAVGR